MEPRSPPLAHVDGDNPNNLKYPEMEAPRRAFTIRRNPTRRARPQTPAMGGAVHSIALPLPADPIPFNIDEVPKPEKLCAPPPAGRESGAEAGVSENLRVFLRIRPLGVKARPALKGNGGGGKARGEWFPEKKARKGAKTNRKVKNEVCLVVNGNESVTLTPPPSYLVDSKRAKCEVYNGFSCVFPPDSLQSELYQKVMAPLVRDFMEGKNGLLVAMGPTGSGKTHTMFGSPREPGMVPLALQQIFCNDTKYGRPSALRHCYLSMFEICSERGKSEKFFDLSPCGGDLSFQHSILKGLQEVMVSSLVEAECLIARGMLKRATAATNANDQSSRSHCVINIHLAPKSINGKSHQSSDAVLTIVDLAGAERERRTGNQGTRLVESNFINNTSMVFGLCLRSLLEHQKNPTKALQKHFQNSLLTKYLRDYLEGKKRFTLILTAKPGEDDYLDTSFLLRQASPYMKIKFSVTEEVSDVLHPKRCAVSLCQFAQEKRRKFCDSEVLLVHGISSGKDGPHTLKKERSKDIRSRKNSIQCPDSGNKHSPLASCDEEYHGEMQRLKRNQHITSCFSRALWNVLKEYKHKLEASEIEVLRLKETLGNERIRTGLLEQELQDLRSLNSVHDFSLADSSSFPEEDTSSKSCSIATPNNLRVVEGNNRDIRTELLTNDLSDSLEIKSDAVDLSSSAKQDCKEKIATLSKQKDMLHHGVLKLTEEQPQSSSEICHHNLETTGNIGSQSSTLPGEVESTSLAPILQNRLRKEVKSFAGSDIPVADDGGKIGNDHVNQVPVMEKLTISKRPNADKPKRRLLPASKMLLKEFSGLDIDAAISKEGRVAEKKEPVEERQRSQGSISLVRLLRGRLYDTIGWRLEIDELSSNSTWFSACG